MNITLIILAILANLFLHLGNHVLTKDLQNINTFVPLIPFLWALPIFVISTYAFASYYASGVTTTAYSTLFIYAIAIGVVMALAMEMLLTSSLTISWQKIIGALLACAGAYLASTSK